jgi:GT2 family glycosyltransferase
VKTTEHPKVAVIILNYNGRAWLEKFLPAVVRHTSSGLARIWVADNASSDDSLDFVRQHFPSVSTFKMPQNYGFAEGYNHAIRHIASEYTLLLNSDVEVSHGWLDPLVKCLDKHPQTAACQGKIKDYNNPKKFEYAGAAGGFIDAYGYPFCRGRIFDTVEEDYGQYDESSEIFWGSGACLLIRRKLFLASGGFDTDFFAHMEEIDLCWRLKNMGYAIRYVPESTVYHVGGGTLDNQSNHKLYLNFRNNRLMLFKNLPIQAVFRTNFIRNMLDIIALLKAVVMLKFGEAWSIFKAHLHYLKALNKFVRKRAEIDQMIRMQKIGHPNSTGRFPHSLVWVYFIRKKKRFTNLKWK